MVKGLYTAYTGMINEQNRMDIMTNNLANASTVGYKKEGSTSQSFDDVLTVKIKDQSVGMRNVQRLGVKNPGVKIGENYTDYSQGSFRITGNTYDLALSGEGFFTVEFKNKIREEIHSTLEKYNVTATPNGQFFRKDKRSLKIWKRSKAFNRRRAVLMRHGEPKKGDWNGL